jgi:protein gp37
MKKTKIEWVDCVLNPVVGCPRGCPYCYAKKLNDRFKWIEDFSKPQFFPERLEKFESKTPKSIFVNSMSDIAFWDVRQCNTVLDAIEKSPQHNYIFLTKAKPAVVGESGGGERYFFGGGQEHIFTGVTVTTQKQWDYIFNAAWLAEFFSFEPLFEPINLHIYDNIMFQKCNWCDFPKPKLVIIGAETGNRKDKIAPKKEWIDDIVRQCENIGWSVFMKNSLKEIMGADFRQDRLPWEINKRV